MAFWLRQLVKCKCSGVFSEGIYVGAFRPKVFETFRLKLFRKGNGA